MPINTVEQKYLEKIYYNPSHSASFQGPRKLYQVVKQEDKHKITFKQIQEWLQKQEPYALNRFARHNFPTNRVVVEGLDSQWDVDLADLKDIKKHNDGYSYWLVCIDIFSRYAFVRALKTKSSKDVIGAFKSIFKDGRVPKTIRSDAGSEFKDKRTQYYLKSLNIHHFFAHNTSKANYAERFIKTLKSKVFRQIISHNKLRYIDHLQDIVKSYNVTKHTSLGMVPKDINKKNEAEVRYDQYLIRKYKKPTPTKYHYKVGDKVRITYTKDKFDREYGQKWSGEIFTVVKRQKREGLPVYWIKDWNEHSVKGSFYQYELQRAFVPTKLKIEKILKRRTRNRQKEVLVKWLHWPSRFNQWLLERDLKKI